MILRECLRHEVLTKIVLNSQQVYKFFDYVEMNTFDIASDAFATFKVGALCSLSRLSSMILDNGSNSFLLNVL